MSAIQVGDYVLATKYEDGDPGDEYAIGFYAGSYQNGSSTRHLVNNDKGQPFRANGFRRVAKISKARGEWLITHFFEFENAWQRHRRSVWWWLRASMRGEA